MSLPFVEHFTEDGGVSIMAVVHVFNPKSHLEDGTVTGLRSVLSDARLYPAVFFSCGMSLGPSYMMVLAMTRDSLYWHV